MLSHYSFSNQILMWNLLSNFSLINSTLFTFWNRLSFFYHLLRQADQSCGWIWSVRVLSIVAFNRENVTIFIRRQLPNYRFTAADWGGIFWWHFVYIQIKAKYKTRHAGLCLSARLCLCTQCKFGSRVVNDKHEILGKIFPACIITYFKPDD